ncbi:MAG: YchJ family protein [Bradymonadaceae bacterium]
MKLSKNVDCPCKSGDPYGQCCAPYHAGELAPTPVALMRSRFSAYALKLVQYVMDTTHPEGTQYRPNASAWRREVEKFCRATRFRDLEIISAEEGESEDEGFVTFRAELYSGRTDVSFTERSVFRRHEGAWKYHSGEHLVRSS